MSLKLYVAPGSCALVALWALERTAVDYELVSLNLAAGDQRSAAYLAINPHGRVPALAVDGTVITELNAVLTYLAARFPDSGILPMRDPMLLGRAMELLCWFSSTIHVHVAQTLRGERFTDEADVKERLAASGKQRLASALAELEERVAQSGKYLTSDQFNAVDMFSVVIWRWAQKLQIDSSSLPCWADKIQRDMARPEVVHALELERSAPPAKWQAETEMS
ncbi:glutathione S-transferase family protein [Rhizorhabdus argentea]|uniref:glutathione S-transferase family protein n=1 Tax=Rhizorhabdus argentea TaxID=1387174 RepID=UPI0030ECE3B9